MGSVTDNFANNLKGIKLVTWVDDVWDINQHLQKVISEYIANLAPTFYTQTTCASV